MAASIQIGGTGGAGKQTQVAGTPIQVLVWPRRGMRSRLDTLLYTPGATSHTLTVMQALAFTTVAAAAAAGQTTVVLKSDPGVAGNLLAIGDWLAFQKPDGTYYFDKVAGWTVGTLTAVMTANVPAGGLTAGSRVWNFGIVTDTVPATGQTHPQYNLPTGSTTTVSNPSGNGVIGSNANYEPILINIDNITNAGNMLQCSWIYTIEGGTNLPSVLPQGAHELHYLGLPTGPGWTEEGFDSVNKP